MASTLQSSNHRRSSTSIFSNLTGLLKINRTYRKTRTNLLILHEKGVINLYYILSFILLVILATLSFVFVWQIILFPRMEENSGFEHYPKNLVPKDMFNRTHLHFSLVVCQDDPANLISSIINLSELEAFDTEKPDNKLALHFHVFTTDHSYEKTTMAIDELLYTERYHSKSEEQEKEKISKINYPGNFKFHMHNRNYHHDCSLELIMSPNHIFEKYRNPDKSDVKNMMGQISHLHRIIGLDTEKMAKNTNEHYFEEKNFGEIHRIIEEKTDTVIKILSSRKKTLGYIFDVNLLDKMPPSIELQGLVNSEWRTGVEGLLETLYRDRLEEIVL